MKSFHVVASRLDVPGENIARHVEGRTIHDAISKVEQELYRRDGNKWDITRVERTLGRVDETEGVPA